MRLVYITTLEVPNMKRFLALSAFCLATLAFGQDIDCDTMEKCQEALKANKNSALIHFRLGENFFADQKYLDSANNFREALNGNLMPKWVEVWAHINLGKIFDVTGQRERALNEYRLARRTGDNTRGA
jgi:tetratricopeptide (TPR) repeat protein